MITRIFSSRLLLLYPQTSASRAAVEALGMPVTAHPHHASPSADSASILLPPSPPGGGYPVPQSVLQAIVLKQVNAAADRLAEANKAPRCYHVKTNGLRC